MIFAACVDLYSTLIHEAPANPFRRLVACDLGLDTEAWHAAYRQAGKLSMTGPAVTMADRVWAACCSAGAIVERAAVERAVERRMPVFYQHVLMDPQAHPMLAALRALGLRLALVSNASAYSRPLLISFGLRRLLDAVILSCDIGVMKPAIAIYHKAAAELGVAPSHCAFIGDGGDDELGGARRAGMRTILVDRMLDHTERAAVAADARVGSLSEVSAAVHRLMIKEASS